MRCTGLTLTLTDANGNVLEGVDWQVAADRLVARENAADAYAYARAHRTLEAVFAGPFDDKERA